MQEPGNAGSGANRERSEVHDENLLVGVWRRLLSSSYPCIPLNDISKLVRVERCMSLIVLVAGLTLRGQRWVTRTCWREYRGCITSRIPLNDISNLVRAIEWRRPLGTETAGGRPTGMEIEWTGLLPTRSWRVQTRGSEEGTREEPNALPPSPMPEPRSRMPEHVIVEDMNMVAHTTTTPER
ncbi:uncharacterized protein LOC126410247 [Nymphaea colorata]|uniref:uncharacterized protein LOC126410247 n=1 Tax=Nymphaea colorata TaxID=210225 RepID=UPI00214EDE33|nr:uncharacterized protein LOC126410247 [Nymphaea colorata]